ncbi:MAG: PAS domain S-box protein [bacterium]
MSFKNITFNDLKPAITSSIIYLIIGFLWIFFSDKFVENAFPVNQWHIISTYKGWVFVFLSALLIFTLVKANLVVLQKANKKLEILYKYQISIFDEVPILIWRTDSNGKDIYFNKTWLNFTGNTIDQQIEEGWLLGVHPEDRLFCKQTVENSFLKREKFNLEFRLRYKDGLYRWISNIGSPYYNLDGEFEGYIGACNDISENINSKNKITKISHLYLVLSKINEVIANIDDEKTLFNQLCSIGCEYGEFKMTWIGISKDGLHFQISCCEGENKDILKLFKIIDLSLENNKETAAKLIKGDIYVCKDAELCHLNEEMSKVLINFDISSLAAIPIIKKHDLYAIFIIFSTDPDFFDEKEIGLLKEIENAVSFAVAKMEVENERVIAEKKLTESEQKFRELVETMNDVFWLEDLTGSQMIYVSPAFEKIWCVSVDELFNNNNYWKSTVLSEDQYKIKDEYEIIKSTGSFEAEYRVVTADNKIKWIHSKSVLVKNEKGEPYRIAGLATDITEKKESEMELIQNRNMLSEAQRLGQLGSWEWDINSNKIIFSGEMYFILGVLPDELTHNIASFFNMVHPEDRSRFITVLNHTIETKEGFSANIRMLRKDGVLRYAISKGKAIVDSDEKVIKIIGFLQDVTEKITAEKRMHDFYVSFQAIINGSPIAIFDLDKSGFVKSIWNQAAERIFGLSDVEVIGKIPPFLPDNYYEEHLDFVKNIFKGKLVIDYELVLKKNDNTNIDISIASAPLYDSSGKIFAIMALAEDITEKKRINKNLIASKEKAEKADKLKTEFLAQMSHEIRTPINVIISFSSLVAETVNTDENPELVEYFASIKNAGKRIIQTIDSILNMSELQSGSYEVIKKDTDIYKDILMPFYNEFIKTCENKSIGLELVLQTENSVVNIDKYSTAKIFENLIDNAIKYTLEGGIKLIVKQNENKKLEILVSDTGIGISEEFMRDLFEPFRQEEQGYSRRYEGNGLGLSLVKKYCEINDIFIGVESKKGVGTTFKLVFG